MEDLVIVSFVFNIILVVVTTVYVILTWRLSNSAKEQIQVSKDIHKASKIEKLNIYKTTLLAIKSELIDHEIRTEALSRELYKIKESVKDVGDLITNRTSVIYDAIFLDKCRDRLLEYEDPNFEFFQLFSFYVNRCDEFNKDLTFERIINTKQFVPSPEDYKSALNGYFEALQERVKMLKEQRDKILPKIDEEVANYLPSYLKKEV